MRLPTPAPPDETGTIDGLAYTLWRPAGTPRGGLIVVHGAGSRKENHHDMARAARGAGLAAVCFDMRGHGASEGVLDDRALDDVATVATLLPRPLALRGSSMGGWVAIAAAERLRAAAVVAVCPASSELLVRGLRARAFDFAADEERLAALLDGVDLREVVARSRVPLMIQHAEGDERVPVELSRELHALAAADPSKLIVVPGGHHRSVQHDDELQAVALRFVDRCLRAAGSTGPRPSSRPGR